LARPFKVCSATQTNGYSKKLENHRVAVELWIAFFCRVHETLRCTPAMALA